MVVEAKAVIATEVVVVSDRVVVDASIVDV